MIEEKEAIDHFANYEVEIIKEGVGTCSIHHCNLWQVQREVNSMAGSSKSGEKELISLVSALNAKMNIKIESSLNWEPHQNMVLMSLSHKRLIILKK